jgi:hypothetical protein
MALLNCFHFACKNCVLISGLFLTHDDVFPHTTMATAALAQVLTILVAAVADNSATEDHDSFAAHPLLQLQQGRLGGRAVVVVTRKSIGRRPNQPDQVLRGGGGESGLIPYYYTLFCRWPFRAAAEKERLFTGSPNRPPVRKLQPPQLLLESAR